MIAYVLSNQDLKIKDILEFEKYEFLEDINYSNKSSITVSSKPGIEDDDFVICKDGNSIVFIGICDTYSSGSDNANYKITLLQKECFFDRKIFIDQEALISNTGIEDFIVNAIRGNFTDSGDALTDKIYIKVFASTHTRIAAKVDADDGTYNLKTYLGNVKEYYGIYTDFSFSDGQLLIEIKRKDDPVIPINIEESDVSEYRETYSVAALTRLRVCWKIPDGADSIGEETYKEYYLRADRTITTDKNDPMRASGIVKSVRIEAQKEEEMLQEVYNQFTSNQYSHKITFELVKSSRLYPSERFYVGRKCMIKTKTGVKTSIVTGCILKDTKNTISLTFGNLKVTLIEKLRS